MNTITPDASMNSDIAFLRNQAKQGNPNAIALWALSILELDHSSTEDTKEFISLIEEDDKQNTWIGKLACTMVKFHSGKTNNKIYYFNEADGIKRPVSSSTKGDLCHELSKVIDIAVTEFYLNPAHRGSEFFMDGMLDFSAYKELCTNEFAELSIFRDGSGLHNLERTISLLRNLAHDNCEAQFILGISGDTTDTTDGWLVKASNSGFMLASYRLGFDKSEDNPSEAIKFFNCLDCDIADFDETPKIILDNLRKNAAQQKRLLIKNVDEKARAEMEIAVAKVRAETTENMMAMFAHQFRGSVGSLLFNAEHQHDERLYLSLAHSMFGLLDTFSIVSTTPEKLSSSLKADTYGNDSPGGVLLHSMKLVLAELLSKRNRLRISPYYLAYAKRQGIAPGDLRQSEWMRDKSWVAKEIEIQSRWEQDIGAMMATADIQAISQWLATHLLPVQIKGFEESTIRFAEYGPKASLLTVVFTEILVNAIKHSVAGSEQTLAISWSDDTSGDVVISCANPSTLDSRQREMSKGSGRGHKFLKLLAEHMGGHFDADVRNDNSRVSMVLPGQLMRAEV